jgi:alpha-beta hydrolase superfamily lysophospholipase
LAAWLNARQVAVLAYDQQGFGQSDGPRGHAPSAEAYFNDVHLLVQRAQQLYPTVPLFLYGHSMGGNVVLNYALRRQPAGLAGLIATGPWIRLAFEAPLVKVWAGRLLRGLVPRLSLPTELNVEQISSDPAVVRAYQADPLVHDRVSAAAGIGLIKSAAWLNRYSGPVPCPVLLMHGGADGLTSATATRELASRLTGDVTHHEWPGMFHEIHNEPNQAEMFEFTLNWMLAHP